MMQVVPIPAFNDNYIWLMHDGRNALVVDPGDAKPVQDFIVQNDLTLRAILITHHHMDHTGGLPAFAQQCPVFGPSTETITGVTQPVHEGDEIRIPHMEVTFRVLDMPGHTLGHVAYVGPDLVFCGDTLFSAGCGRLFEGSPSQMRDSLTKLAQLPPSTRVFCTHEYTLANLAFAQAAEPDNPDRDEWLARCQRLRAEGKPTLPTTIGLERKINPFLRVQEPSLIEGLSGYVGHVPKDPAHAFAALREWKNNF